MIRRLREKVLLQPDSVKAFHDGFKVIGVFNPGVISTNGEIAILARVAEAPEEHRDGYVGLPRNNADAEVVVDWIPANDLESVDARVVRFKSDGHLRLTSISYLQLFRGHDCWSTDWVAGPTFLPESSFEEFGVEDPRITWIDGTFYITYVAVSRWGAATAFATTKDFVTFDRHGIIFCPENKDVVLFPHKVNGQFLSLHRPSSTPSFSRPQIWLARSSDLIHWGQHECVFAGVEEWEDDRVGAGAPPLELQEGWLQLYHGSRRSGQPGKVGTYSAGALLLDRDHPSRVLRRSLDPIILPTTDFETTGFVENVVFPTALIESGDSLRVFYGAADTSIGVVELSRSELLEALK